MADYTSPYNDPNLPDGGWSTPYTSPYNDPNLPDGGWPTPTSGEVLGAATGPVSGDGGGMPSNPQVNEVVNGQRWTGTNWENANTGESGGQSEADRIMAEQRSGIESAYGNYEQQLDLMLNESLPAQHSAQLEIAESQQEQGVADAASGLREGQELLASQEEKTGDQTADTIKDIATNLKNLFMAGNVYLGAKGARDSSAANQYAYALTKLANKQRGDVQSQSADIISEIGKRASSLKSIYTDETARIKRDFDQKVSGLAQWFAEQQQNLQLNKADLGINKEADLRSVSQNILNTALQQMESIRTEQVNRRDKLETWAMNNATTIQQLRQNMQGVTGQRLASVPGAQPIAGQLSTDAGGNVSASSSYTPGSSYTKEEAPVFSRPVEYLA